MLIWGAIKPHLYSILLPLCAAAQGAILSTPLPDPRPISFAAPAPGGEDGAVKIRAAVPDLPPVPTPPDQRPGAGRPIVPNSDGLIDLAALDAADAPGALPNPFIVRYRPPASIREVSLAIDGVLVAGKPEDACAIVNGEIYSPGDALAGLTVSSIAQDAIELRAEGLRLRIPVGDKPVRLRLPR